MSRVSICSVGLLLALVGCGSAGGVGAATCGDAGPCPSGGFAGSSGFGAGAGAGGGGDVANTGGSGGSAGESGGGGAGAVGGSAGTGGFGAGGSGGAGGDTGGSGGSSASGGSGGTGLPPCAPSQVVLSQIYGGGGAVTGSLYSYDFIVLHNRGVTSVSIDGWSLQYAAASGVSWAVAPLDGTIAAGGYFLVQLGAAGGTGAALPTPDAIGGVNLAQSSGKIALVKSTSALVTGCPIPSSDVADFVGYGTADCSEGALAAPAPSKTTSLERSSACDDSDVNGSDFAAAAPEPRNAASAPASCGCGS